MKNGLIKFPGLRLTTDGLRRSLAATLPAEVLSSADVQHAVAHVETYVYLQLDAAGIEGQGKKLQTACRLLCPGAQVIAVQCTLDLPGRSFGNKAAWHYVVETDVRPEAEDDFNAWYGTEHMPGLAAVPGTIQTWRYIDSLGSPKYYAAYDLETLETFGSDPWLAVRGSDWSSRVRPNFFNTKRTMFKKDGGSPGEE
ncbi:DUF4286 family protein [Paralcaligenes ureilyticus]|uniref:Uncharacterized protein n=1 Tax=Paralcaligenes ureilyticus TaxID=627131 RepID=A0A4R3M1H6_9BURK|nr:DUF4286 family protein [Paralcaligenes ureilyticus]TCT06971.1 hypothetical protein EDC26_10726 [Paralcaligenes ureilyticus]